MRSALEGLYATGDKPGPWHHFVVAADPTAELGDDTVALVADVAQCLAPNTMMFPREGWEGQQHYHTPASSHCALRQPWRLGGPVPRPGGNAQYAALDRPPPLGA